VSCHCALPDDLVVLCVLPRALDSDQDSLGGRQGLFLDIPFRDEILQLSVDFFGEVRSQCHLAHWFFFLGALVVNSAIDFAIRRRPFQCVRDFAQCSGNAGPCATKRTCFSFFLEALVQLKLTLQLGVDHPV